MGEGKPNALHFCGVTAQKSGDFEQPTFMVKFTNFSGNAEIETETDTGHTGTRSLTLGEDRVKADASPEIEDKFRLEQGLEDYFWHILGDYVKEELGTKTVRYTVTPNAEATLPLVSVLHGFNVTGGKSRGFANCIGSELELTMNSGEAPSIKIKYASDFPIYEVTEPTIIFPEDAPQSFKAGQLQGFMSSVGAMNESTASLGCLIESSLTISNNVETSVCAGTELGSSDKDVKELSIEGSLTVKYNNITANLEQEWATGSPNGANSRVTYASLFKALRIKYVGSKIETVAGNPAVDYFNMLQIDLPSVDIIKVSSTEAGEGSKNVTIEFKATPSLTGAEIIEVILQSTLVDMHKTP